MNIEQMLRDAIERKTAKILKEEYGIETPKEIADKLSKDDQEYDEYDMYETHYEEGDDYDDVPASMLDERHMKFAKPNMPTHWMKMPTHPQ